MITQTHVDQLSSSVQVVKAITLFTSSQFCTKKTKFIKSLSRKRNETFDIDYNKHSVISLTSIDF